MKQEYEKEKKISAELRKQYSLALLRFKFAERKVYPETCVLRVIVQEPTNSTKKKTAKLEKVLKKVVCMYLL